MTLDECAYRSRLRKWNVEWKLLFAVAVIFYNLLVNQIVLSVVTCFFMAAVTVGVGRISPVRYERAMRIPLGFILLGSLAVGVELGQGRQALWQISLGALHFYATAQSLNRMCLVAVRALAAVSAMYLLTLSTPAGEITGALRRLPLPGWLTDLMNLIYRYIFLLSETYQNMNRAAQSRLGMVDFVASCRTFGSVASSLLAVSLQKSREYYDALEARCYQEGAGFYTERRAVCPAQLLCMLCYFLLAAGCLLI